MQIASALDDRSGGGGQGHGARVIVFDEPTSSLAVAEVQRLLAIVRRLAAGGITVLYVSHRMGEIFEVCDRVTVLRDGRYIATSDVRSIDEPALVEQMIGRRLERTSHRAGPAPAASTVLLEARGVDSPGVLRGVSLSVRAGEVLGVGGLVGSGRSELLDALFGLDRRATGLVAVGGRPVPMGSPRAMIDAGVGYVPEDRKLQGLFFLLGVDENIATPAMPRLAVAGLRAIGAERRYVAERLEAFRVKTASASSLPGELSGGNQQKLLIARWMGRETRVLLLDEPTRGIDVGTKAEIYRAVRAAAQAGAAVLLVSSEMAELLALSDRLVVMRDGAIAGELTGEAMTQANILRLATGGVPAAAGAGA
ncbi:MAG: sugar ABC transporter ATP-binding protein [Phycisphaeraceae bacterium]|nr:sugar ABC transporter ATP-binding protein [Phycisphaeraceae bacterium]